MIPTHAGRHEFLAPGTYGYTPWNATILFDIVLKDHLDRKFLYDERFK